MNKHETVLGDFRVELRAGETLPAALLAVMPGFCISTALDDAVAFGVEADLHEYFDDRYELIRAADWPAAEFKYSRDKKGKVEIVADFS